MIGKSGRCFNSHGMAPIWSSCPCVTTSASTRSILSSRYEKSGRIKSTPGSPDDGNNTPQSTIRRRPRYSKTVMLRPISEIPPSATMRSPSFGGRGGAGRRCVRSAPCIDFTTFRRPRLLLRFPLRRPRAPPLPFPFREFPLLSALVFADTLDFFFSVLFSERPSVSADCGA